jgi:hypothetical protein
MYVVYLMQQEQKLCYRNEKKTLSIATYFLHITKICELNEMNASKVFMHFHKFFLNHLSISISTYFKIGLHLNCQYKELSARNIMVR